MCIYSKQTPQKDYETQIKTCKYHLGINDLNGISCWYNIFLAKVFWIRFGVIIILSTSKTNSIILDFGEFIIKEAHTLNNSVMILCTDEDHPKFEALCLKSFMFFMFFIIKVFVRVINQLRSAIKSRFCKPLQLLFVIFNYLSSTM